MLRTIAFAILSLVIFAPAAVAGPWPRAKGETFLSLSVEQGSDTDYFSLYAEYGLRENLTLGLDLGATSRDPKKAIAFARWPVGDSESPLRMAAQIGVGYAERWRTPPFKLVITGGGPLPPLPAARPKMRPVLQTGFALGRSIKWAGLEGWTTLDTRAEIDDDLATHYMADATLGLKTTKGHMFILQLQTGATDAGATWAKLAPSYVLKLSDRSNLELGVTAHLTGDDTAIARLGLWHRF
jgi:hypothetical protein